MARAANTYRCNHRSFTFRQGQVRRAYSAETKVLMAQKLLAAQIEEEIAAYTTQRAVAKREEIKQVTAPKKVVETTEITA